MKSRLNNLVRAFETIKYLSLQPMSAAELSDRMGVDVRTAYRYIDAASIAFPVIDAESRKYLGRGRGSTPTKFHIKLKNGPPVFERIF